MTQLDHLGTAHGERVPPIPTATAAAARRTIAHRAVSEADALLLLEMCGLIDEVRRPVTVEPVGELSNGIRD